MASLKLSHIYKVYENGHKAVNDFNIDIKDKEFIVFVGPSGCGKSTTLRMVAGLEKITAGDMFIGDTLVNDMEPKDRDIAMVFQNYALYPHMTVFENMAFGLRNRHMPEAEIKQKVLEAAKILDIEDYLQRKPKAMSGGQRQRVALGRAIVRDPKVFLLDEPLSNLDAKLRAQMRTEITKLHKKLATTFIYVTHDQVEAMTMGTRIVVMKLGYVQQIDTPMNLYNEPYNKFVAGFIGTPQMNFFDVTLKRVGDDVEVKFINDSVIKLPYETLCKIHEDYLHGDKKVILGIRPDHLQLSAKPTGLSCVVNTVEHLGNECNIYGQIGSESGEFTMKDEGKNIILKVVEGTQVNPGDVINIAPMVDKVHFFDSETEITLMSKIPNYSQFKAKVSGDKMEFLGAKVPLFPVLKEHLNGQEELSIEVSPYSVVPGKTYSLKVHSVEEVGEVRLAHLACENRYLFAVVDESVKAGQEYKFDLLNDKLRIAAGEEVLLEPVKDEVSIDGLFAKEERKEIPAPLSEEELAKIDRELEELNKELTELQAKEEGADKKTVKGLKKEEKAVSDKIKVLEFKKKPQTSAQRVYHFFAVVEGVKVEVPLENGYKMNSVEGNRCYQRTYRYVLDRKNVRFVSEGGIEAQVEKLEDYGNVKYAVVDVKGQKLLLLANEGLALGPTQIAFDGKDASIHSIEIDMRIC